MVLKNEVVRICQREDDLAVRFGKKASLLDIFSAKRNLIVKVVPYSNEFLTDIGPFYSSMIFLRLKGHVLFLNLNFLL